MKGQAISMDFIMTFVIYLFALSIFFYGIKENIEEKSFDVDAELILDKVSQLYVNGVRVTTLTPKEGLYNDLGADTCIFLKTGNKIHEHFASFDKSNTANQNPAFFKSGTDEISCEGSAVDFIGKPMCKSKNSILLTKPVLYNKQIAQLGVLLCK